MAGPTFLSGVSSTVALNGKDLSEFGVVRHRLNAFEMPTVETHDLVLPGRTGVSPQGDYFRDRTITLSGEIHGDTRAELMSQLDDFKMYLTTLGGRSTRGIRLETTEQTDRCWQVFLNGQFSWEPIGPDHLATGARISVGFHCVDPFAVATGLTEVTKSSFTAGDFQRVDLGTAPSHYKLWLHCNGTDNPSITMGDMIFKADFDNTLDALDIDGNTVAGTYYNNAYTQFSPSESGMQFHNAGAGSSLYWNDIPGNPNEGSVLIVFRPQWAYDTSASKGIFFLYDGSHNGTYIRVYYDKTWDTFYFWKRVNWVSYFSYKTITGWDADTRFVLVGTWGPTLGVRIYMDGEVGSTQPNTDPLDYVPDRVWAYTSTLTTDVKYDLMYVWGRELSADEAIRYTRNPALVERHNVRIDFTLAVDDGDTICIDSEKGTAELLDTSNVRSNVTSSMSNAFPALIPPATCLYYPEAVFNEVRLAYFKRWI